MIPLTARQALDPQLVRVTATRRPAELEERERRGLYAVFDDEDAAFLGLVTEPASAQFPHRIFADLLPKPRPAPVAAETPLEEISHRMATEGIETLPVLDEEGTFLGAITRESLLEALLRREQQLLGEARGLQKQLEVEQKRLLAWSKRQEELNEASRRLLDLVGQSAVKQELSQEGLKALAMLLQARYGAIGLLDGAGRLHQFIVTGLTPEEADRIGELPQGRGLLGVTIRENQVLRLADLAQDPRHAGFPPHHPPMKSLLAVPISHQGQIYGRVYLCDKTTGEPFTEDDERLAVSFARFLGQTLAHAKELAERKRAEHALRESEQRFRLLAENAQDIIYRYRFSPTRGFEYVSPAALAITGYTPEEHYADPDLGLKIVHPDERPLLEKYFQGEGEFRQPIALRWIRKDGTVIWTEQRNVPIYDKSGDLVAIEGIARDITDFKWADEALRVSEARFRTIFEGAAIGMALVDVNGRVVESNPALQEMLGYSREELRGMVFTEFTHPDDATADWNLSRELFEGKHDHYQMEKRYYRNDGRMVWGHLTASLLRNASGEPHLGIGMVEDITERKRAEEALRALASRQAAVAALGQRALGGIDLTTLMDEATATVARTLDVEFCKILELLPDGDALLLRAGVGWKDGYVGHATVPSGTDSQAGYTLISDEPVIAEDLRTETRFSGPPLLRDHGVISGISVVIQSQDRPFGVMGAHTTRRRTFTQNEIHFLQAVANVIATAIQRKRAEEARQALYRAC